MDKRILGMAIALAGVLVGTVACGSAPSGSTTGSAPPIAAQDPPVTLRLALADGRNDQPPILAFADRVESLSGGNITIEPIFEAGNQSNATFETSLAEMVQRGEAEFTMTGSRVWDLVGVTSLQALQAPFLIDTDELALAVAKSDIATRALDGMAKGGVDGLAIWPQELRHLYAFSECDKDFRTPAGIAGATILVIPSQVSRDVVKALGGIEYLDDDRGEDAQACRLHGIESGSTGVGVPLHTAVSTGNAVLFAKYEVLVANEAALDRLTEGQRAVIEQAAREYQQEAYGRQPDESELAAAWCAGGGTVQLASADELKALKAATAYVTLALEQDPLTKELIADISALKASLQAPPSDVACGPTAASESPGVEPSVPPQATEGFLATAIPDGTYRTEITEADLLAKGASPTFAKGNDGVKTWTFQGNTFAQEHVGGCQGTYEVMSGSLTFHGCDVEGARFLWRPEGDGIVILPLLEDGLSARDRTEISAYFDRVMSKVD